MPAHGETGVEMHHASGLLKGLELLLAARPENGVHHERTGDGVGVMQRLNIYLQAAITEYMSFAWRAGGDGCFRADALGAQI